MIKNIDLHKVVSPFIGADEGVAVGVSGGPDSMALCHLLAQILKTQAKTLHVLTVDHGLRAESALESQTIGEWLAPHTHLKHTVLIRDKAAITDTRLQESAREDRYKLFSDYCAQHHISKLFLAHHADDQAETVLFRLAKGSGIDGLAAMKKEQNISSSLQIVRPLLDIPKADLIAFCRAENIEYFEDPSNKNDNFARVRLRKSYNILEEEGLSQKRLITLAARSARAQEALEHYSSHEFERLVKGNDTDVIELDFCGFRALPLEICFRIFVKSMAAVSSSENSPYGPRMEKVERLVRSIREDESFTKATLGGAIITARPEKGLLIVEKELK